MRRFGGPDALEVIDVNDPVRGPRQVLVDVEVAGVRFVETQVRGETGPATRHKVVLGVLFGGEHRRLWLCYAPVMFTRSV